MVHPVDPESMPTPMGLPPVFCGAAKSWIRQFDTVLFLFNRVPKVEPEEAIA